MGNYEEKYKKALEDAKQGKSIEEIFPELAESEDERNERIRTGLIKILKTIPNGTFEKTGGITLDEGLYWLERKEYEQKPVERNKEDEKIINILIESLEYSNPHPYFSEQNITIPKLRDWLKSLKNRYLPQSHWKPSEEQMDALSSVGMYSSWGAKNCKLLQSLYSDLQKLM